MLLGHYGAALAGKAVAPELPLAALMLGTQAIDYVWAGLVLGGVEKVRMQPGYTATTDFELVYYPYSHSLPGSVAISAAATALLAALHPGLSMAALAVFFVVCFSHWLFDLIVHTPDLPLIGDRYKVGFGLWNNRPLAMAVEFGLFVVGAAMFLGSLAPGQLDGAWLEIAVVLGALALIQVQVFFGPPMKTHRALGVTALLIFTLAGLGGWWIDTAI